MGSSRPNNPFTSVRSRRAPLVIGAVVAIAAAFTATTVPAHAEDPSPSASASATAGKTLTVSMDDSGIDTLNPFLSYYNASLNTFGMIYPSLATLDAAGTAIPYLAKSWEVSADQKTWTFTIQSGLTWSDGKPITAADAAWTLNLIMTDKTAGTANGSLVENFATVTAPNDTTLVITTKEPQSNMLYLSIPISGIPIVPKHVWESHVSGLKDYKNNTYPIVGYGPWTLTNYVTDQYETFSANHGWTNGQQTGPKFDTLVVRVFKNSDARVAALRSGQLDLASVEATQFTAVQSDKELGTYQSGGDSWLAIEVNAGAKTTSGEKLGTGNPILADNTVRQAMHLGIDKAKLVTNLVGGKGIQGAGYLPPAWPNWFWTPADGQRTAFDVAGANALLDKAGYAKGSDGVRVDPKTKQKLSFRLGIHADRSDDAAISALFKGWMEDLGIQIKIESMSMTMLNDNLGKGDWDLLMDAWSTGPDPTYLLSIQTCGALPTSPQESGMTDAFFCDKAYDALYSQQLTTLDPAKRQQIVAQMQEILYKANQDIILYYPNTLVAYRSNVLTNVPNGTKNAEGTYPAQNVFDLYLNAAPVTATQTAASGTPIAGIIGGIAAALVVVGVVVAVVVRRRRTAGDRE